jgi:hypothetical protein
MKRPSVIPEFGRVATTAEEPASRRKRRQRKVSTSREGVPMMRTSLYISEPVHDVLREIAFNLDCKIHDLFREGIEAVLKKHRHPSIDEINDRALGTPPRE